MTILALVLSLLLSPQEAIERIAVLEDTRSLGEEGELTGFLSHGNPKVRARACLALGRIQTEEGIAPLRSLLRDPEGVVRREAAFALGQIGLVFPADLEVTETLSSLSREKDPTLRGLAAEALGKMGGEKALGFLAVFTEDPDAGVRRQAATGLARLRAPAGVPALVGLLGDPSWEVRAAAAYGLGLVQGPLPVEPLRKAAKDKDPLVRFAAYQGVRRRKEPVPISLYLEGIGETDPRVLVEVLWGLAAHPLPEEWKEVVKLKGSPHLQVRAALARCLSGWTTPEAAEALKALSVDPSPMVRREAASAWGRRDDGLDALLRAASDPHFHVRSGASAALRELILRARKEAMEIVLGPLLESPGAPEESLRRAGPLVASPIWAGVLPEPPGSERIRELLGDPSPEIRRLAARAAQPLATGSARPLLLALLDDPDPWVRGSAALSLRLSGGLGPGVSVREIPPAVVAVYAAMASGEVEPLLRAIEAALSDADPRVRIFAARALTMAGDAGEELGRRALEDPDGGVVRMAARTLVRSCGNLAGLEDPLRALARGKEIESRLELAWILPESEASYALSLLRDLAKDPSDEVRRVATLHLAWSSGAAPEPGGGGGDEMAAAAELLARAGRSWQALRKLVEDPHVVVQAATLEGLRLVPTRPARVALVAGLSSGDPGVAFEAAIFLRSHPVRKALPLLERAYERWKSPGDQEVRREVVRALAALRGDATRTIRMAAESDPDPVIREEARIAYREQTGKEVKRVPLPPSRPSRYLGALDPLPPEPKVLLEMEKGPLTIELYPSAAPIHVRNFLRLAKEGFYDGLTIHRVVPNFVVQGGDPLGTGWGYEEEVLRDEINTVRYVTGTVGMPKAGKDTGGCQMFITHVPTPWLDGRYTAFGRVTSGLDLLDQIEVGDRIRRLRMVPGKKGE